jgi:hypothetical protein
MCDVPFIVVVLQIPLSMFSESGKIMKYCSTISSVSPVASASAVDAILGIL